MSLFPPSDLEIWLVIVGLGLATYAIRFSFLGLIGDRALPPAALLLLRYVPTALIPALVAPMVVFPRVADGGVDPLRVVVALAALGVAIVTKHAVATIAVGMGALWLGRALGL